MEDLPNVWLTRSQKIIALTAWWFRESMHLIPHLLPPAIRQRTTLCNSDAANMTIHQVFEHGEILAMVRFLLGRWLRKYPRICTPRFNFTKLHDPIKSHSMPDLAAALARLRRLSTPKLNPADRLEQLRMIYDYIKFHIGLYIGTPPVLIILAQGMKVHEESLFVDGMVAMVILYLFAGAHAA